MSLNVSNLFSKNLLYLLKKNNISQLEFATILSEKIGKEVKQNTISNWVTGRNEPSFNTLLVIAQYFDTDLNSFLEKDLEFLLNEAMRIYASEKLYDPQKTTPAKYMAYLILKREQEKLENSKNPKSVETQSNAPLMPTLELEVQTLKFEVEKLSNLMESQIKFNEALRTALQELIGSYNISQ